MKNNSLVIPIVSPRVNNMNPFQKFNFLTLDYTTNNQQSNQNSQKIDSMSKTLYLNHYDNKKFKIRAPVQSVKTTRVRNYEPFQRIKKVQELIKRQKQYQELLQEQHINEKQLGLTDLSPKNRVLMKLIQKQNLFKLNKSSNTKNHHQKKDQAKTIDARIQQIQSVIKNIKKGRQSHVKEIRLDTAAVPKRQNRLKIQNIEFNAINLSLKQNQFSQRVKNTKKLSQRGRNRKKCNNYSLLSRINKLNEYQQNFTQFHPTYNNNRASIHIMDSETFR